MIAQVRPLPLAVERPQRQHGVIFRPSVPEVPDGFLAAREHEARQMIREHPHRDAPLPCPDERLEKRFGGGIEDKNVELHVHVANGRLDLRDHGIEGAVVVRKELAVLSLTMGSAPRLLFNTTSECSHPGQSAPRLTSELPSVRARTRLFTSRCLSRRGLGNVEYPTKRYATAPSTGMKIMASTQAIADDGRRFIDTRTAATATRKTWTASASKAMVSGSLRNSRTGTPSDQYPALDPRKLFRADGSSVQQGLRLGNLVGGARGRDPADVGISFFLVPPGAFDRAIRHALAAGGQVDQQRHKRQESTGRRSRPPSTTRSVCGRERGHR